jgi:hypothetical protein
MRKLVVLCLVIVLDFTLFAQQKGRKFFPDDPVWEEPQISAKMPGAVDRSEVIDFLESTYKRGPRKEIRPAANVNTVGGVPDSSWFTNRIGKRAMTLDELRRGPNQLDSPDLSAPWEVVAGKSEGITAGFQAKDASGDTYFVKLDVPDYPQLTTSAEVIATKFLHAFGYNVPENYLVSLTREQLRTSAEAQEKGLDEKALDDLLRKAAQNPDGSYQMLASRKVEGKPIGQFKFWGTRPDDPNDIFTHEDRRELRGLRLFAAWLNHVDIDTINTLDAFIGEEESGYVKHYLIDFGTTFGSGAFEPQRPRVGNEYVMEWGSIAKSALTLGLWERPWQKVKYPSFPQIGNFEADFFQPHQWKPDYPNPAFQRMRLNDAFWAVSIIAEFTDEMVREIVKTGQIKDPDAEDYLVRTLLARRDKILAYYLGQVNPLDRFEILRGALKFMNLGSQSRLGEAKAYEYTWYSYDDQTGETVALGESRRAGTDEIAIPLKIGAEYLMVHLRTISDEQPEWAKPVFVYLRLDRSGHRIIGIEREEEDRQYYDSERRRFLVEKSESKEDQVRTSIAE